jgi:hypothetical protein
MSNVTKMPERVGEIAEVRAAIEAGENEIAELHGKIHGVHERLAVLTARQRTLEQRA